MEGATILLTWATTSCFILSQLLDTNYYITRSELHNGALITSSMLKYHLFMMLSYTFFILLFLAPLQCVAAPIDKSPSLYHVIEPTSTADSSPPCYRRWRHYGSHLTFRLARLHTCCSSPEQQHSFVAERIHPLHHPGHKPIFYSSSTWSVVPRGRRFSKADDQ